MEDEPRIPKFYAGKKIFITGATGLIGKILLWKLLQSCPLIETIYVLIRSKHGKSVASRKEEFFNIVIFDELKKNNATILEKVQFITGDVGRENLGLSSSDRKTLIDNVNIVFHGAAMLNMSAGLEASVNVNTVGTLKMLDLAGEMKKLEMFVYVSTTYCCCDNKVVEEKIYMAKQNPHDILQLVKWMDPEMLKKITPGLIAPLPNTYTYSKRLTESLLLEYQSKIPLIVARPSIVISAFQEPLPGWNDNLNGPLGLTVAGGKGVFRATMANANTTPNLISADILVHTLIVLPWVNTKESLLREIQVYNIGQTESKTVTWKEVVEIGRNSLERHPFTHVLWWPDNNVFHDNIVIYKLKVLFFHWLPAYLIDFILILCGQKTFLVRMQTKLQHGENVLRYFARRQWIFVNDKVLKINEKLSSADKKIFHLTMKNITNYQDYMDNIVLVLRDYCLKEKPRSEKLLIFRHNVLRILDYTVKFAFYAYLIKLFYSFVLFVIDRFENA